MAKRNGKKTRRPRRKAGDPFGASLLTRVVLQVISEHMTEAEFMTAYDAVPRKRRGGPRGIPQKVRDAYVTFKSSDGDDAAFQAFVSATGKSVATAERYLGRLVREENSN